MVDGFFVSRTCCKTECQHERSGSSGCACEPERLDWGCRNKDGKERIAAFLTIRRNSFYDDRRFDSVSRLQLFSPEKKEARFGRTTSFDPSRSCR
jgi:hypothetical protein